MWTGGHKYFLRRGLEVGTGTTHDNWLISGVAVLSQQCALVL